MTRISTTLRNAFGALYGSVQRLIESVLDRRWGLPAAAAKRIELETVGFADPERRPYGPSPWGVLRRVVPPREVTREDVFLDLGCGMGRILIEAGRYPFGRAVGVEIVPEFADVAREVVERNAGRLRCPDIEVVTADVRDYRIPDDVTIVYLAAPFGPALMASVIEAIEKSFDRRPRKLRIIYIFPPGAPRLDGFRRLALVRRGRRGIRRWAPADYLSMYEVLPEDARQSTA